MMDNRDETDRYDLMEVVGRGGMSTVWRAYDRVAEMEVAVKVLHEHLTDDENLVETFEREAGLMQSIDHPGVVRVFGTTEIEGRPAIAMEYCPGGTLDVRLAEKGRFDEREALEIVEPVLEVLDAVHEQGIVHRDVKPQNILFDEADRPKLIDFGIGQTDELVELEGAGQIGTVEYMAPERIDGLAVDGRSDVYSAGVVLFELLAGHPPYRADAASAVMRMHREAEVPEPDVFAPQLSDRVGRAVRRALKKHPEERFDTAAEMSEVLVGSRSMRAEIEEHPVWETLLETYGGDSPRVAPIETEGHEWVVFTVGYEGFGAGRVQTLREIIGEHHEHLAVDTGRVGDILDTMRTGTTVGELLETEPEGHDEKARDAVKWQQMFAAYGVARGLSRQGAEELVGQLEDLGIVARFAQRRRRRREPSLPAKIFSPDHLAAGAVAAILTGVVVYLMAVQRGAEQGEPMGAALMAGFLGLWVVAAVASAWSASAGMIAELWRSNFSRRYLLDFSRTSEQATGNYPVAREHVELVQSIQSPRIAASFERAMNVALHLWDLLDERGLETAEIDRSVDQIAALGRRIVDVEATVAAIRPGEVAGSIRRLDNRIEATDDIDEIESMMDRKAELRRQLEQRDRAQQKLQRYGQRLLELATRFERLVWRYRDADREGEGADETLLEASEEIEELTVLGFDVEVEESEGVVEEAAAMKGA